MIDLEALHFHPQAEPFLELEKELYHPNGVEPARRQEVGVRGWHVHVEHVCEQIGELRLQGAGRGRRAAPTVPATNNPFHQHVGHVLPSEDGP